MTDFVRNEADVREEVIAPILAALDYRSNGRNSIRRELHLTLKYPRDFLGHKKPTDPALRGKADYVCYAGRKVAWTIEAKAEGEQITQDAVEQAYTYAKHPEVRAVYFCLCNGIEFRVYITDAAPDQSPILTTDPRDCELAVARLTDILGAAPLLSRFAARAADTLPPLGAGLSSFAQIVKGHIVHERQVPPIPSMQGFTVYIQNGTIERADTGLLAVIKGLAPFASIQRLVEKLGLTALELRSSSTELSSDPQNPTHFSAVAVAVAVFPKGEMMPDITSGTMNALAFEMYCQISVRASVTLEGGVVTGPFEVCFQYLKAADASEFLKAFTSTGTVTLHAR
jgi:hypothetical protein